MLNPTIAAALNTQIKNEFESAYAYLAMAAYCDTHNYPGMAHWLKLQAREELAHAMRFYDFVNDRGGRVDLQALEKPQPDYASLVEIFEGVLKHEEKITATIHYLYALALQEKDFASYPFLQEFIVEQIEEEKRANQVLADIRLAGTEARAILLLDRELGRRAGGE